MPLLERKNPETPCPEPGVHHPHRLWCSDTDCDCWLDSDDGEPFSLLACCIDAEEWPCTAKRERVTHGLQGT
jgi:hypothetical protein